MDTSSPNPQNLGHPDNNTFGLFAPIVDFGKNAGGRTEEKLHSLNDIITGSIPPTSPETAFRWIHIPMNHMGWAEKVVRNVLKDAKKSEEAEREPTLADCIFSDLRWNKQRRGIGASHPLFAQYMLPNFWKFKGDSYGLFMPYLHWDKVDAHEKRSETIKWVRNGKPSPEPKIVPEGDPTFIGSKLIKAHLAHDGPLHVRRSLNQYYYDSEIDEGDVYKFTDALDKDQVVYKYTDRHKIVGQSKSTKKRIPKKKHVMMMVDQLWLWVLKEDGITPTVVTSFPSLFKETLRDFRHSDIFSRVMQEIQDPNMPHRGRMVSEHKLALRIVKRACGVLVSRSLPYHLQVFFMFEQTLAELAWRRSSLYKTFQQKFDDRMKSQGNVDNYDLFDISWETRLAGEVKGIMNELNIMSNVVCDQKAVVQSLIKTYTNLIADPTSDPKAPSERGEIEQLDYVNKITKAVERMEKFAEKEYQNLKDLLDLKQKQASVAEAVQARQEIAETAKQGEAMAKQGETMMLFTVVTVIFLPPTFFTSVFSMNAQQWNGSGLTLDHIAAISVPTSLFLVASAFFLAFNWRYFKRYRFKKPDVENGIAGDDPEKKIIKAHTFWTPDIISPIKLYGIDGLKPSKYASTNVGRM